MPSTKAYQARKRDIAVLNLKLAESEYLNRKLTQELNNRAHTELDACERARLLTKLNESLKIRVNILEDYIRHAYWDDIDAPVEPFKEIPVCLKPMDAIRYAGGPVPLAFPPKAED